MAATINPTLPSEWKEDIVYNINDKVFYCNIIYKSLINNNINNKPAFNTEKWQALDIYKKDETVMEIGSYSGDDSFWERDEIKIDGGYIFVNNENTGIRVYGDVQLTPSQKQELTEKLLKEIKVDPEKVGPPGPQGIQGEKGEKGDTGTVELTPEQIDILKGDKGDTGESAFEVWKRVYDKPSATEEDYLYWLQNQVAPIDTHLSPNSRHGVQNRVITDAIAQLQIELTAEIDRLTRRVAELESRLTAVYHNQNYDFRFGVTTNGEYGYRINNSDNIIPFAQPAEVQNSIGVESINGVFFSDFGETGTRVAETLTIQDEIEPATISLSPSSPSETLGKNVIINNIEEPVIIQDLNDFNNESNYNYIYKNNQFENTTIPFSTVNMTIDSNDNFYSNSYLNNLVKFLYEDIETLGYYLNFVIEPKNNNQTIKYTASTIIYNPDTEDSYPIYEVQNTCSSKTTIKIQYKPDIQIPNGYIVSHTQLSVELNNYKITQIYLS